MESGQCWHYLSSHAVTRILLSAHMSLTSVFGMEQVDPHGNQHQLSSPLRKKTTNELHSLFSFLTAYSLSYSLALVKLFFALGDPGGNRTHVNGVRGRCLNRLTTGPHDAISIRIFYPVANWCALTDSNRGPTD